MTAFPKIKATYLRLQTGALYAKLMAERQAHTYQTDVLTLTDMTFVLDLQKRGGWMLYEFAGTCGVQAGKQKQAGRLLHVGRRHRRRYRL